MEKQWKNNINTKIKEKRADCELMEFMKEWSNAKSNFNAESARKRESQYLAKYLPKNRFNSSKVNRPTMFRYSTPKVARIESELKQRDAKGQN